MYQISHPLTLRHLYTESHSHSDLHVEWLTSAPDMVTAFSVPKKSPLSCAQHEIESQIPCSHFMWIRLGIFLDGFWGSDQFLLKRVCGEPLILSNRALIRRSSSVKVLLDNQTLYLI